MVDNWLDADGRPSCPECDGFGYTEGFSDEEECETCGGRGVASQERGDQYVERG